VCVCVCVCVVWVWPHITHARPAVVDHFSTPMCTELRRCGHPHRLRPLRCPLGQQHTTDMHCPSRTEVRVSRWRTHSPTPIALVGWCAQVCPSFGGLQRTSGRRTKVRASRRRDVMWLWPAALRIPGVSVLDFPMDVRVVHIHGVYPRAHIESCGSWNGGRVGSLRRIAPSGAVSCCSCYRLDVTDHCHLAIPLHDREIVLLRSLPVVMWGTSAVAAIAT
jgi:hypothetical protein